MLYNYTCNSNFNINNIGKSILKHQKGHNDWWGKVQGLVGHWAGLVGNFPTTLYVKRSTEALIKRYTITQLGLN